MANCGVIPDPQQLVSQLIGYFDCQANAVATFGFAGLAAPGGLGSSLLWVATTIMIALFGYRLMFADPPSPLVAMERFGRLAIVLALATGFAAFNQLVANVILQGPSEVAQQIIASAALIDQPNLLGARLDAVDQGFRTFAFLGAGATPAGDPTLMYEPSPWIGFDNFATGMARVLFVVTAMSAAALPKMFAGMLLASAPIFLLFLLFDRSRWLVAGWLRMLVASAVASMAGQLLLAMEGQLFATWLADLVSRRAVDQATIGAPAALFSVTVLFLILTILCISWSARLVSIASSSGPHPTVRSRFEYRGIETPSLARSGGSSQEAAIEMATPPDRAQQVASSALNQMRRETTANSSDGPSGRTHLPGENVNSTGREGISASRYAARRALMRQSAASQRRGALR